tara:strand:- start:1067 stop:2674 length:1608 start_codon:yes stop_codon:yes gene_type:complete
MINWTFNLFETGIKSYLIFIPFIIVLIASVKGISNYIQTIYVAKISFLVIVDLQKNLLKKLLHSRIGIIEKYGSGNLIARFINDTNLIDETLTKIITSLIRDTLTIIALVSVMVYLDWFLTLITLILYPILSIPIIKIGKKVRILSSQTQEHVGVLTNLLNQNFQNINAIKSFQLEDKELSNTSKEILRRIENLYKIIKTRKLVDPIIEIIGGLSIGLILAFVGFRIMNGYNTIGEFTAFITALIMISDPLRRVGGLNTIYQEGIAALDRVYTLFNICIPIEDKKSAVEITSQKPSIKFKKVKFRYDNDDNIVLKDLSFDIKGGTKNYIIGESGAGKTTIFNLLIRLYEISSGSIVIDNNDIKNIKIESLREHISLVTQNIPVFNDTLKNNIKLLEKNNSKIDLDNLIKELNIDVFANNFDNKLDTKIGINGVSLSGGQLQRVAIARAIYKNSSILLLDEATSFLDSINEVEINKTLDQYFKDKTVLIIAHRLSTIENADNIILMKKGEIVSSGDYKYLLKNSDYFRELIKNTLK